MFAPKGNLLRCVFVFGVLGFVVNFREGYSNSYPNTSYKSFQALINDSYISRGNEEGISENLYVWIWSGILNVWSLGYLVGTFFTPYCTDNFGRKKALLGSNCGALIGSIMSFLSVIFAVPELFFASSIVLSICSGISFGALMLFFQEATPTEYRGITSFLSENSFLATTVLGVGFGMDAIFGKNLPILTAIAIIPAAISIILVTQLEETPKFLLLNARDRKAARKSLRFYSGNEIDLDATLDEMMLEENDAVPDTSISRSVISVLRQPHLRTPFFIGFLSLQIVIGIWSITYLSTDMLDSRFPQFIAQMASLFFILANFIAGMVGMLIIEKFGRRSLMLWLGLFNTLSLALFVAFDQLANLYDPLKWGSIFALILFGATYGIGLGAIAYFITSEMVAQQYRALVQSMVYAANIIATFAFSFATLPAFTKIGSWSFIPLFIIPSCLALIYLYFNMPETMGREVHEIVEELIARNYGNESKFEGNEHAGTTSLLRHGKDHACTISVVEPIRSENVD